MNNKKFIKLINVLGNDIRLSVFRMLIKAGDLGLNPKYISDSLDIKANKLSFHLNSLKKNNLIKYQKNGRELTYYANYKNIQKIIDFLFENCCNSEKNCLDINKKN
jgi:ArsR family transcriptional regulator, arsenate/arsenite/antimonite-responsive transcriptional repressor